MSGSADTKRTAAGTFRSSSALQVNRLFSIETPSQTFGYFRTGFPVIVASRSCAQGSSWALHPLIVWSYEAKLTFRASAL